jgi:cobalt/nickel transport system permease protein
MTLMLAATFASLQLSISGTIKLSVGLPTMLSAHAIIGIGEAAITTSALMAIWRIKPDLMRVRKF